jgi:hypothetical protein
MGTANVPNAMAEHAAAIQPHISQDDDASSVVVVVVVSLMLVMKDDIFFVVLFKPPMQYNNTHNIPIYRQFNLQFRKNNVLSVK